MAGTTRSGAHHPVAAFPSTGTCDQITGQMESPQSATNRGSGMGRTCCRGPPLSSDGKIVCPGTASRWRWDPCGGRPCGSRSSQVFAPSSEEAPPLRHSSGRSAAPPRPRRVPVAAPGLEPVAVFLPPAPPAPSLTPGSEPTLWPRRARAARGVAVTAAGPPGPEPHAI